MADGGIMEAALLGAAVGGGTSLVTGQDPLKGALLGGLTGGAFSGVGSALGAGAGASTGTSVMANAAPAVEQQATQALTGAIGNPIADLSSLGAFGQPSQLSSLANIMGPSGGATNLASTMGGVGQTANTGITGLGGMQPIANTTPDIASAFTQAPIGVPTQTEMAALRQGAQQGAQQSAQGGIRGLLNLKPDSLTSRGLDWWDKQDTLTQAGLGGVGLLGANALMQGQPTIPEQEKYKSKLAGYNRDEFTPTESIQPMPYYGARYAAEGGLMQSYAQGGIAALAGREGSMYPQSQQDHTQYATPTQMPTSSSVINAGYEAQTNPYTGEPVQGFAIGGMPSNFGVGSTSSTPSFANAFGMGGQQGYQGMGGWQSPNDAQRQWGMFLPQQMRQSRQIPGISANFQASSANPQLYQSQYNSPAPNVNQMPNVNQQPAYSLMDSMRLLQGQAPNIANQFRATTNPNQQAPVASGMDDATMNNILKGIPSFQPGSNANSTTINGNPQYTNLQNQALAAYVAKNGPPAAAQGGQVYPQGFAQGGGIGSLGGYAHGGNPQLLDGPGDGMSDSIPASIGNRQPARLAQGEFVVPADVVSHLGNGSTDAGAKHLYSMMDKVRKARTGNPKQGKQINASKYLA